MKSGWRTIIVLVVAAMFCRALIPSSAAAQGGRLDVRHGHDRHYQPHGHTVRALPQHHRRVVVGKRPYYYHQGVFYRSHGTGFAIVRAPIGAVVHVLPRGYVTLFLGGVPYYYANYTYYRWDRGAGGYRVVEEPADADSGTAVPGDLFVYPKAGQDEAQIASDRYECHRWAVTQTGSDPSAGEPLSDAARGEYHRAMTACLEARSYSVK